MKDPAATTAPDLVDSDFSAAGLQYAKKASKGQMRLAAVVGRLFHPLLQQGAVPQKGVAVPKTFDEMVAAAEKLTDAKEGTYGFVGRGLRNALT